MDAEFWGTLVGAGVGAAVAVHKAITVISAKIISTTAAQSTVDDILKRVKDIELDLSVVKKAIAPDASVDHRSPK